MPPDAAVIAVPAAAPQTPPASPAGPPAASPAPAPATDWRAGLPEDVRAAKTLEKFVRRDGDRDVLDTGRLAKAFVDTEKAFHGKQEGMVKVPLADVNGAYNETEVAAWRQATGVPALHTDYKIEVPEDLKSLVSADALQEFTPLFHKLGLNQAQAQTLVQANAEHQQKLLAGLETKYRAEMKTLELEWGTPTYNRRIELAKRAVHELAPEGFIDFLEKTHMGSHPDFIKIMSKVGEAMAESGHIDATITTGSVKTKQELEDRKIQIQSDPNWYTERDQGAHNALVVEWNQIVRQLNPEPIR